VRGRAYDPAMADDLPWWASTVIYQVYPRSFADSNGDGIGDLRGAIDHLDHLVDLGVGTVWFSPFFDSPQADFGYDISDYCGVAPEYGTLDDAQRLIEEAHDRGLKVMFDMVMNHTSDQHPWFRMSKASRSNPKSDWYIWRDGRGRGGRRPPNNWKSAMEVKSAWQWCPERQQWYLASFLPFQPDLNYRNPEVKEAMFEAVRFWLRRGVDGFRLDIFGSMMKDPSFRDNPWAPHVDTGIPRLWERRYTENTEDTIQFAKELRAVVDEFRSPEDPAGTERVLLGEVFGAPDLLRRYLGDGDGLHLTFLFDFLAYRYDAGFFRSRIETYEREFPPPLQPTYVLENHDRSRLVDRVDGDLRKAQTLAVMLCTLRGVPTIYQGQEIGMSNTRMRLREARDPIARTYFSWVPEAVVRLPERLNRDEVRTPMQWTGGPNAGFTTPEAVPWLPVNPNHTTRNVEAQTGVDGSMLELYRSLLHLRSRRPSLHRGSLRLLPSDPAQPDLLAYERIHHPHSGTAGVGAETTLIAVNLGSTAVRVRVGDHAELLVASDSGTPLRDGVVHLPAHSAVVVGL
jgi:alpha-glucosidase